MKFIPAIDLKNNQCVRLEKGLEDRLEIFNTNPVEQAKIFENLGCQRLHIVDLDEAFGRQNINKETILKIRKEINIPIELGGGIRTFEDIFFWKNKGIDFLVIGSLATKDKELVINASKKFIDSIYIAADVLENKIMIKGWVEDSKLTIDNLISNYKDSTIRGFIFTDISRDGLLSGLNINLIKDLFLKTNKNIIVGGGLSNYRDLENLKNVANKNQNLEGVIAGKSIYSGKIEIKTALQKFFL